MSANFAASHPVERFAGVAIGVRFSGWATGGLGATVAIEAFGVGLTVGLGVELLGRLVNRRGAGFTGRNCRANKTEVAVQLIATAAKSPKEVAGVRGWTWGSGGVGLTTSSLGFSTPSSRGAGLV